MKNNSVVKVALGKFKENELIIASKLYKEELSNQITEAAYYKTLQRMCEAGELVKIAKGTYHLPKVGKYGIVPPSEKEIIAAFTENKTGSVVGYSLYNELNLTTQISKTVNVLSSALDGFSKSIRNIVINYVPLKFSPEVEKMIQGLEVLQNFNAIQDINYSAFVEYSKVLAQAFEEKTFEEVISKTNYKKSTISFLKEILNYYNIKNNLNKYLSSLSEYKHPRMEELYETARVSQ
ncbi:MAG: type IV toxin-antitoxin system AbiEi family antitoxin domain-containing protein [Clostridia bacterium]|nr:type IV toxin-antitoxin system AbiEi family antitoxin domain-containing protein [Clostridia bacterium]